MFGPRSRCIEWKTLSFSQCTSSYYKLLHQGNAIVNSPSGLDVKTPLSRIQSRYFVPHSTYTTVFMSLKLVQRAPYPRVDD
jgi:hypothetical protein